jgi:hypothetical protein
MGLWDNPNTYGMLMGSGTTLAIALQVLSLKSNVQSPKSGRWRKMAIIFLFVAIFMMSVGLVMSYSRGAWLGTVIGLLYLAWCYGKLKWKYVAIVVGLLVVGAGLFWGRTPDSAPWYIKRADLGRPSAQHRASAWRAGLEIMRDHPLGVGWNNAVSLYDKNYNPPEGGAGAITTNDYMMLGTELGIPALLCFVAYVALCFRNRPFDWFLPKRPSSGLPPPSPVLTGEEHPAGSGEGTIGKSARADARPTLALDSTKVACRSSALVLLIAFWFDGGLFDLPTAAIFWILLELGSSASPQMKNKPLKAAN